jgi:hypothetical protein
LKITDGRHSSGARTLPCSTICLRTAHSHENDETFDDERKDKVMRGATRLLVTMSGSYNYLFRQSANDLPQVMSDLVHEYRNTVAIFVVKSQLVDKRKLKYVYVFAYQVSKWIGA